jgi:ribosomal protein S27AE
MTLIPPRSETIREELQKGDRRLLHCFACGGQVVARRHRGSCGRCGSEAIVVEDRS